MKRTSTQLSTTSTLPLVRSRTYQSYGSKRTRAAPKRGTKLASASSLVRVPGLGFPDKIQLRHRYISTHVMSGGAGTGKQIYNFRANGMFDPDQSGTGHQPLYFDQAAAIYDNYTVIASFAKVTFTTTGNPHAVGVYINDDSTVTPSSVENCMEQSNGQFGFINNASNPKTFFVPWNATKAFGGSVLSNNDLQGSSTSDPIEQEVFTLYAAPVDVSQATSVQVVVEILYTAVWTELKDIASS